METEPLLTTALLMGLLGSLAIFLYEMEQMTDALKVTLASDQAHQREA